MKLSFDWLSEFVDLEGLSAAQVAEKLTMGAFEVEEVTPVGAEITGPLVLGEILEINPHPNASKIRLTKTRVAPGAEPLEIVCGAANIEVGHRIAVALDGACVVNRHDGSKLEIKISTIRGVKSNGMLCSAAELGIATDDTTGEGIYILNDLAGDRPLGTDIRDILDLKNDYILHVEPRSNRGDALCVAGLAREVAALFNRKLKTQTHGLDEFGKALDQNLTGQIKAQSQADEFPYFSLRTINGIKIGKSPAYIAKRLEAMGLRTVNNVVDITNYVMHELGQPLHAYDLEKITGNTLTARFAREGEKITTLDGKERSLTPEVLVIADGDTAVGIAGIMGSKDSEISQQSSSIVLEAAAFDQATVRKGSRLLGFSSDASLRFERGVDRVQTAIASERACYLIAKHCACDDAQLAIGDLQQAGDNKAQSKTVDLRLKQIDRILGISLDSQKIEALLTPLGFGVQDLGQQSGQATLRVSIPSFRQSDITREIDLIEEICRLNGYDKIAAIMPSASMPAEAADTFVSRVKKTLTSSGLSEAWLSSLVPENEPGIDHDRVVSVLNPLSKDHQLLRQSLIPGLLKAVAYNQDRGRKDVWMFEAGRVYERVPSASSQQAASQAQGNLKGHTGSRERQLIAAAVTGEKSRGLEAPLKPDYYLTKGLVENLLEHNDINLAKIAFRRVSDLYPWLHPHRAALVTLNRPAKPKKLDKAISQSDIQRQDPSPYDHLDENITLGYVGEVHPRYKDQVGLRDNAWVFELDLAKLELERKPGKFKEIPNTPEVLRDLTCDFENQETEHQAVCAVIIKAGGPHLKTADLVSVFKSDRLSLTYRMTFQNPAETLTNDQVESSIQSIRKDLSDKLKATFRA